MHSRTASAVLNGYGLKISFKKSLEKLLTKFGRFSNIQRSQNE